MLRGQREKMQNGQKGDKRIEDEGGAGVQHLQRRARLYSRGIEVGGVQGGSHSATSRDASEGQLQK